MSCFFLFKTKETIVLSKIIEATIKKNGNKRNDRKKPLSGILPNQFLI